MSKKKRRRNNQVGPKTTRCAKTRDQAKDLAKRMKIKYIETLA